MSTYFRNINTVKAMFDTLYLNTLFIQCLFGKHKLIEIKQTV